MSQTAAQAEINRVGKFGAVGVFNTLIDFLLFNIARIFFGLSIIPANIFSTTVAMMFSFFANRHLVFKRAEGHLVKQGAVFFAVTATGLYVIQTSIIYLLIEIWTEPLTLAVILVKALGLGEALPETFVVSNAAKAAATIGSLTWNYLCYKFLVFK